MAKTKYVQCGLRLTGEIKAWVDEKAKKENRSFNNFIETKLAQLKEAEERKHEQRAA